MVEFIKVDRGDIKLNVAVSGSGPLILCIHGWPELWYSWRHQIDYFSTRGFKVAAMDVRGYGGSSRPYEIEAYTMKNLTADVAAVVDQLGSGHAILLGHDWGAPIVWNTALLYPDRIDAVAGLSVPYFPKGDMAVLDLWKQLYPDRFFYQLYFQQEGVVEDELEADIPTSLRKIYFALSGNAETDLWLKEKPVEAKLLDGLMDPDPYPDWLSAADLQVYVDAFAAGGFRGPVNRYRAQTVDHEELEHLKGLLLKQPSYFVGGERDAVRHFVSGGDSYSNPGVACADFRGSTIIPDIGHWVQQEAPAETNEALAQFLGGL